MTPSQLEARYNARRRAKEALRPELSNNDLHALTCSALADTHGREIRDLAERTNDPLAVHIVSHWGNKTVEWAVEAIYSQPFAEGQGIILLTKLAEHLYDLGALRIPEDAE